MKISILKIKSILTLTLFSFCNTLILSGQDTSLPVGSIPGSIDVSQTGAATYTIPIAVAPGSHGMQPNLAIVYNSQAGMGLLGSKWSLSGLSAIIRVPQTNYHDSTITAVNLTLRDRFALDGNRLLSENGIYGAHGSTYVTEVATFSDITSYGTAGNGPEYFKVITKDGNIIEYGGSVNARQMLGSTVLSWMISKVTDPEGNYMTFNYGQADGEIWLSSIHYTMGPAISSFLPNFMVNFEYQTGEHYQSDFIAGYEIKQTKLLKGIRSIYFTPQGHKTARRYMFDYTNDHPVRLTTITQTEEDGSQLNPTIISWGDMTNRNFTTENFASYQHTNISAQFASGDFNCDGISDIVEYTNHYWQLYLKTDDGLELDLSSPPLATERRIYKCVVMDEDGDGCDELLTVYRPYYADSSVFVGITRFSTPPATTTYMALHAYEILNALSGDFTGSGGKELLLHYHEHGYDYVTIKGRNCYPELHGRTCEPTVRVGNNSTNVILLDFNGNGKTDFCIIGDRPNTYSIYEYNNVTDKIDMIKIGTLGEISPYFMVGDFNGDGISDLIWKKGENRYAIALGTGTGFKPSIEVTLYHRESSMSPLICDINGDGKDDFIGFSKQVGLSAYCSLSKGYFNGQLQFECDHPLHPGYQLVTPIEAENGYNFIIGAFNPNHKYDFMIFKNAVPTTHSPKKITITYFSGGNITRLVNQITDGMGYTIKLSYAPFYALAFDNATHKRRPVHFYVPQKLQLSNGIGSAFNEYRYAYSGHHYSFSRKSMLGFSSFSVFDLQQNTESRSEFEKDTVSEILIPVTSSFLRAGIVEKRVNYTSRILHLGHNSFIRYDKEQEITDLLSGSKQKTSTSLLSTGLPDSLVTTVQAIHASEYLTREEKKYTYTNITLPNGITRPSIASVETNSYLSNSSPYASHTTNYTYLNGRLHTTTESNADGAITTTLNSYNAFGQPLSKTISAANQLPRTESYQYDLLGRFVTGQTNSLTQTSSATFDPKNGNILTATDINGLTTSYAYNAFGQLHTTSYPDGTKTTVTLHWYPGNDIPNAKYYSTTVETGKSPGYVYYDLLGREVCRQEAGSYFDTRYNNLGQLVRTSLPYTTMPTDDNLKIWNEYAYDAQGRKSAETAPYSSFSYSYTPGSVSSTDILRDVTYTKNYDAAGRIVSSTDPGGAITYAYGYISENGKTRNRSVISSNGSTTVTVSDLWGNRLKLIDPDAGTSTATYTDFNELVSQTDANGNITSLSYDLLGRISLKTQSNPNTGEHTAIRYVYDTHTPDNRGNGQLSAVYLNDVLSESYVYDTLGRIKTENKVIDGVTYSHSYTYNSNGQLYTITYPGSFSVKYSYDENGRISAIRKGDNNLKLYEATGRNKFGQVSRCLFANGLGSAYVYNDYGRITQIRTGNKVSVKDLFNPLNEGDLNETDSLSIIATLDELDILNIPASDPTWQEEVYSIDSTVQNLRYTYDSRGLMVSRRDGIHNQCETFYYDNLDRLTAHGACGIIRPQYYQYGNSGNIIYSPYVGNYLYENPDGKPHAVSSIEVNSSNIMSSECCVTYNAFNRPSVITEDTKKLKLYYDVNQNRNKTIFTPAGENRGAPTMTKYFVSKLFEKEKNTYPTYERELNYIYAGNRLIAIFAKDNANPNGKVYYIHQDHLGSYDVISSDSKTVVERQHFDPWGNRKNPANWNIPDTRTSFLFDRGFTGHEHLIPFAIINMNARLYDPVIGRFFSPDPYVQAPESTQGYNRYSYCLNNPLRYTDPNGEFFMDMLYTLSNILSFPARAITQGVQLVQDVLNNDVKSAGYYFNWDYLAGNSAPYDVPYHNIQYGHNPFEGHRFRNSNFMDAAGQLYELDTYFATTGIDPATRFAEGDEANKKTVKTFYRDKQMYTRWKAIDGVETFMGTFVGKISGVNVYESEKFGTFSSRGGYSGVTLPPLGIFVGKGVYKNDKDMMMHEFGHILQYHMVGHSAYYKVIGLESIISAGMHNKLGHNHNTFWAEQWANYLSVNYFRNYDNWNYSDYPTKNISRFNWIKLKMAGGF